MGAQRPPVAPSIEASERPLPAEPVSIAEPVATAAPMAPASVPFAARERGLSQPETTPATPAQQGAHAAAPPPEPAIQVQEGTGAQALAPAVDSAAEREPAAQ